MTVFEPVVEGDSAGDWSLVVDRGEVLAHRTDDDGQLIYSTADRPHGPDTNSEYGLTVREVVHRFVERADGDLAVERLLARAERLRIETEVADA